MSADVRVARIVAVPAERAWQVLTDWERQGDWIPATRVRSTDGHQVGGRIEAWTGLGPVGFLDVMTITAWDPPRRCEVLHTGRVVRGPGVFAVDPLTGNRCRVSGKSISLCRSARSAGWVGRWSARWPRAGSRSPCAGWRGDSTPARNDVVIPRTTAGRERSSRRGGRRRGRRPALLRRRSSGRRRRSRAA